MRNITVLGSTGSIGTNTLDVVRRSRDAFRIHALAAGRNFDLLATQIAEFKPRVVVVSDPDRLAAVLRERSIPMPELSRDLVAIATDSAVDTVMSSIVGVAGLEATYEAVRAGKRVGLANKEVLVSGGALVMDAVRASGCELIPVDSEHNGAHQCLRAGRRREATRLILTASGGPFRDTPKSAMAFVTRAQALKHPTWKMGNRITIDSATLMNKGFEVIEACWLFDFAPAEVDVVVHPQSTVHAMVEYNDGSVIAQICATDMRMPIQYALTWPDRAPAPVPKIDWSESRSWDFSPPDLDRFPALRLAYESMAAGGSATCTLNAADEVAVEAFLEERITFPEIASTVEETLQRIPHRQVGSIEDILTIDGESRVIARALVARGSVQVRV
ncbi:MAG: 1-deoxy-D-xylulose 5-phosphate reductoisomerase [Bryobacterales bacterium]|nr:1-deoxy-D-xylulose 5-phosphate reductoisomerase [Bryobacterales bacterium]